MERIYCRKASPFLLRKQNMSTIYLCPKHCAKIVSSLIITNTPFKFNRLLPGQEEGECEYILTKEEENEE